MTRLLPFLLLVCLAALPAAARAQDPGPVAPVKVFGDPEAPPLPLGPHLGPGPRRATPAWTATAERRPPAGVTRAVSDGSTFLSPAPNLAETTMARGADAGASVVRMPMYWSGVEKYAEAPADPTDPADPGYDWHHYDTEARRAAAAGLTPMFTVLNAPTRWEGPNHWRFAEVGSWAPDPAALGRFATAAARRYSGTFPDPSRPGQALPRVGLWQAWNEPNLPRNITPQWVGRAGRWAAWSPAHYRRLLNAFYDGIKSVDPANLVVTAGTAPDGDPRDGAGRMTPLRFWQAFFCLGAPPRPTPAKCPDPARFDVLALHPLSLADPDRAASGLGLGIADLAKLRSLLELAQRTGRVGGAPRKRLWVTEINWDSRPPDPVGATAAQLRRWIPRALYLLWRQGVDLVTWQLVRDPITEPSHPAGLWAIDRSAPEDPSRDIPKPALGIFRFPVTTLRLDARRVRVWGLVPHAGPRTVWLQRRDGAAWRTIATLAVRPSGLVDAVTRLRGGATVRLLVAGDARPSPSAQVRAA